MTICKESNISIYGQSISSTAIGCGAALDMAIDSMDVDKLPLSSVQYVLFNLSTPCYSKYYELDSLVPYIEKLELYFGKNVQMVVGISQKEYLSNHDIVDIMVFGN